MKKSVKELGKCLLNLDICSNVDDVLEAFVNYMDDVRFDKTGLKMWVKMDPVKHGERLTSLLWLKLKGEHEITEFYSKTKQDISEPDRGKQISEMWATKFEAEMWATKFEAYGSLVNEIKKCKHKKADMLKKLKCLSYDNLQGFDFWKEYLIFTSDIKSEELEDVASDLMIYATFVSNKTSKLLMDFLRKLEVEDDFINHIKRYSDVIRYHRGLFIKNLQNITTSRVSKEEASRIAENLIKYSYCNIPGEGKWKKFPRMSDEEKVNYPLKIDEITSYIMGNNFGDILPFLVKSMTWELNCSGKEIETDNVEFNNQVKNFNKNNSLGNVYLEQPVRSEQLARSEQSNVVNIPKIFAEKSESFENPMDLLEPVEPVEPDKPNRIFESLGASRESVRPIIVTAPIISSNDSNNDIINLDKLEQELKSN